MARLTALERAQKLRDCKELYINGFSNESIHQITNITVKTIASWRDKYNWEEEKELNHIKPSEIRKLVLKQVSALSKGETLPYKTDDISKTVAAFDRITDSRKIAVYTMESIDSFSNFMLEKAALAKGAKREVVLKALQNVRPYFDEHIAKLLQDD